MAENNKVDELTSEANLEAGAMDKKAQRVNNLPLIILLGGGLIFVIIMFWGVVTSGDSEPKRDSALEINAEESAKDLEFEKTQVFSKLKDGGNLEGHAPTTEVLKDNSGGVIGSKTEKEKKAESNEIDKKFAELEAKYNRLLVEKQTNMGGGSGNGKTTDTLQAEQQRALMEMRREIAQKKKQAFMNALTSSSKTPFSVDNTVGATPSFSSDPQGNVNARRAENQETIRRAKSALANLQNNGATGSSVGGIGSGGSTTLSSTNARYGMNPNGGGMGRDRPRMTTSLDTDIESYNGKERSSWDLGKNMEIPTSDFIVRAGFVIPATMISGITSDTAGQIMAQVTQSVYDTATGHHLLVPQGTRLVGTYNTGATFGQERMMIVWQRLVFPDNKTLDLGAMVGADTGGYAGFTDKVNNHWWKMISSAFLMSGVTASVAVAVDDNNNSSTTTNSTSVNSELSQALATQLGSVMTKVIERNLNIAPTLEIRQGYNFNVMVTKDLVFDHPYSDFDYK